MPLWHKAYIYTYSACADGLGLDSRCPSGPPCLAPCSQWLTSLLPLGGWKPFHWPVPGSLDPLRLALPEHLTLVAKILLDFRPRASEWWGMALSLRAAGVLGICDQGKTRGVVFSHGPPCWGSLLHFCTRYRFGPESPWDQKQPEPWLVHRPRGLQWGEPIATVISDLLLDVQSSRWTQAGLSL